MKKCKLVVMLCGIAFLASAATAYAQFSVKGELRTRSEYRHGYGALPAPNADAAAFISQRSRLSFGYIANELALGLSLQDVRVWGDEGQLKDIPSMGLHEAWADITLVDSLGVKLGRQELVYDDHRLLGNVDWVQQGRSHDAAVLHFAHDGWQFHLGGAYNQNAEERFGRLYNASNYKTLSYLWIGKKFSSVQFSALGITDGVQTTDTTTNLVYRHTYGANGSFTIDKFRIQATVYGQSGTDKLDKTIAAYMAAVAASYSFDNLKVGIGMDMLSGTDATETKDNNTFNTLYATNHKFYGHMDYFINVPVDTKGGGLQDIYATIEYQPANKWKLYLAAHQFSLASDIANPTKPGTTADKGLGTEIDFWASYAMAKDIAFQIGYSHLIAKETMEILKGGKKDETANWAWLMVRVSPTLFSN